MLGSAVAGSISRRHAGVIDLGPSLCPETQFHNDVECISSGKFPTHPSGPARKILAGCCCCYPTISLQKRAWLRRAWGTGVGRVDLRTWWRGTGGTSTRGRRRKRRKRRGRRKTRERKKWGRTCGQRTRIATPPPHRLDVEQGLRDLLLQVRGGHALVLEDLLPGIDHGARCNAGKNRQVSTTLAGAKSAADGGGRAAAARCAYSMPTDCAAAHM